MPEENQNQKPIQAPEQADPKYKETLLLYNEQNGAVEAVSDLKQSGNQYKVTTTQPLTANKPAFYELRNSSAVAAFIKGFKEYLVKEKQEDIIPAVSALGYDSYLAAIKAIEDAGSTDTAAIRDALKNVEIDGVTGNITFNETGDANKDIAFIKTIKDGRFQFLTTTTVE